MDIRNLLASGRRLVLPLALLVALVSTAGPSSVAAAGRPDPRSSAAARGGDPGRGGGRLYSGKRPQIEVRMRVVGGRLAYSVSAKLRCVEGDARFGERVRRFVSRGGYSTGAGYTEPIGPGGRFTKREISTTFAYVIHAHVTDDRITGTYREWREELNPRSKEFYSCATVEGEGKPVSFVARFRSQDGPLGGDRK